MERSDKRRSYRCHLDRWFDETMGIEGIPIPYGAPNASPYARRFIRTLREEAMNHFISSVSITSAVSLPSTSQPQGTAQSQQTESNRIKKPQPGQTSVKTATLAQRQILNIPLSAIRLNPNQPRRHIDAEALKQLAESIRKHGLLQPVIVKRIMNGRFLLVAGERRFRASRMARRKFILALLTEANELEIAIIENLQRENLRPIEEAEGLCALQKRFGYKQVQLARVVGRSRVAVNESLKLSELPEVILEECRTSDIVTKHHLLQVARESDARRQLHLWESIKTGHLSVRNTRAARGERGR